MMDTGALPVSGPHEQTQSKRRADPAAVHRAVKEVPRREFFQPLSGRESASSDAPSPPPPRALTKMLQALRLQPDQRVLVVGTAQGYVAAVLSRLAEQVFAAERDPALAAEAKLRLERAGVSNVELRVCDGYEGFRSESPFDAILLSARSGVVPEALLDQLTIGGHLVLHVGPNRAEETLVQVTRTDVSEFKNEILAEVSFVRDLDQILLEIGAADGEVIRNAAQEAAAAGVRLEAVLARNGDVSEVELYRALAIQRGWRFGGVDELLASLDREVLDAVPRAFLRHNRLIPICTKGDVLRVATGNPDVSLAPLAEIFAPAGYDIWLLTPTDYNRMWSFVDLASTTRVEIAADVEDESDKLQIGQDLELDDHYISLFETILLEAIFERASDIHLERYGQRVRVRLRVDGELYDFSRVSLTPRDLLGVINVIKIRSSLDIAEHRLPQGGRIRMRVNDRAFDLRVQTQPSLHGEHVVIRVLAQQLKPQTVEDLGFPDHLAARFRRLLASPSGLVLVVGPTGSGKTTTLYAGLQLLVQDTSRKIITIEDPIEYALEGIQQCQVRPEIGFVFASAMRSFVRQDPDVILVGEIRDCETALEAIRASQTGHLVLSTLHCNDSTDAVQRLFDLGMHANSISSELLAVIAQRLAKRICPACSKAVVPDEAETAELFPRGVPAGFVAFAGQGCPQCSGHGTHGRIAVVEFLEATPALRELIARRPTVGELREAALAAGLVTLRKNALDHVTAGRITLGELPLMLSAERMAPDQ